MNGYVAFFLKDVNVPIAIMQVKVQQIGALDPAIALQMIERDSHIVKIAEPPRTVRRRVVPGRTNEGKARFGKTRQGGFHRSSRSQCRNMIEPMAGDIFDVVDRVDGFNIVRGSREGFFKRHFVLDRGENSFDSPWCRRRIAYVDLTKVIVVEYFHSSPSSVLEMPCLTSGRKTTLVKGKMARYR